MTRTAIRFTDEMHDQLAEAAADHGVSVNRLVNMAVEQYLDRLIPADEIVWTCEVPPCLRCGLRRSTHPNEVCRRYEGSEESSR